MNVINNIRFPEFQSLKCNMMPFIQGDSTSLPDEYQSYAYIIDDNFLEKGEVGFLTIDETFVEAGNSQRGFNSTGIERCVHIEVGEYNSVRRWGSWRGRPTTILDEDTQILIANSIDDTCRVWNTKEYAYTEDGDLSHIIEKYPEHTGQLLKAGEMAQISILTPHECVPQKESKQRQFFRIVGKGVTGREHYFTVNPLMPN